MSTAETNFSPEAIKSAEAAKVFEGSKERLDGILDKFDATNLKTHPIERSFEGEDVSFRVATGAGETDEVQVGFSGYIPRRDKHGAIIREGGKSILDRVGPVYADRHTDGTLTYGMKILGYDMKKSGSTTLGIEGDYSSIDVRYDPLNPEKSVIQILRGTYQDEQGRSASKVETLTPGSEGFKAVAERLSLVGPKPPENHYLYGPESPEVKLRQLPSHQK